MEFAHCKLCNCDIFPHKNDLNRHTQSEKHLINANKTKSNQKIETFVKSSFQNKVRYSELKLGGLLASNNLPFVLMDTLSDLCQDIFPDSEIAKHLAMKRTKASAVVRESLGKHFSGELYEKLRKPGVFFSVIMDETTDVSTTKQCAFAVIFCGGGESNKICVNFLDMVSISKGDAVTLFNCLKETLQSKRIPLENLIGFASDTTNVMVGEKNSVFSLLKMEKPEVACVRCSCHMIHLASSKACLQLPRSVEDVIRNIGAHFSRSSMRQDKLREFQIFFKVEMHKILLPSNTRWLSVEQCVNRTLEQYDVLQAYFRESTFEDPSRTTEDILKSLDNKFTKIYLEFMSYVLGILNDFNKMFQSESPLLYKLKPEVERLLKIIYSNYLTVDCIRQNNIFKCDHKNPRNFLPINQIYLGISACDSLQTLKTDNISNQEIEAFLMTCLNFYIALAGEIKKKVCVY